MLRFNERIKEIRKNKGLTQKALGKLINKSAQVISNWERGYTTTINQDDIRNIARAFNIKISELMSDDEYATYNKSDEHKQSKDLTKFLDQTEIMFDGEMYKLNPESRQKLRNALEFAFYEAKKMNKRKKD